MSSNAPNVIERPPRESVSSATAGFVVGTSPPMVKVEAVIAEIASTNIPVLLVGESGSGKQMFAHRIHQLSGRAREPLTKISCASVNAESFGTDVGLTGNGKGFPNGAGTVFFDEISELDLLCQRSLLYALPDGDVNPRRGMLTSRLISATSRNLEEEIRAGRFRNELYYRIGGVCLRLPALRERKEDIPLLSESFLSKHAIEFGRPYFQLSTRALDAFMNYAWPGNIRELENVTKKIVALNDEDLAVSELIRGTTGTRSLTGESHSHSLKAAARAASREAERELILKALGRTRWNRKRAAQELQISYKSLLYKLKQIGLEDGETG